MNVRPLERRDFPAVSRLWGVLQQEARRRQGWESPGAPAWRREAIEMYARLLPEACLGVEEEGELQGFVFARPWGRTAWLGPWGIEPARQGRGFGRAVLQAACARLVEAGFATIGTETDPGAAHEIGFLCRCGFRPAGLVLEWERVLPEEAGEPGVPEGGANLRFLAGLLPAERSSFEEKARRLSATLDADLDLAPEIGLVGEYGFGDTLFLEREGEPLGFAVLLHKPMTDEADDSLRVQSLLLGEAEPFESLEPLLAAIEVHARESRLRRIRIHAPARSWEGCRALAGRGWRIARTHLRMHLLGYPEKGEGRMINFARWQ